MLLPESEQGRFFDSVQGRLDGVLQPENGQVLDVPCPAAQSEKDVSFRALKMQVPPDWQQTAFASDLSAVTMVAKHLSNHRIKNATTVTAFQAVQ